VITAVGLTFIGTLVLVWLAFVLVARTGAVDVAATADHLPGAEWFFSTLSDRSIRRYAAEAMEAGELEPPGEVTDAMLRTGAVHYRAMCVVCHGAPGAERGEFGQGLEPEPPDLSHTAREMSEAEIFWVLEHGIRHTGMPAFGATHGEEELQAITAFVTRLDGMSPEEYRRLAGAASEPAGSAGEAGAEESDHGHGDHEH
jgi:mono/diheme cytochrome c family protein